MFVSGAGANPDIMDLGGQAQGGWGWGDDAADEAANWFDQQVNNIILLDTCLLINFVSVVNVVKLMNTKCILDECNTCSSLLI